VGIKHGIDMINDVSGGRFDPNMFATIAETGVPYVLMYCKNLTGRADLEEITYDDVVEHIMHFLEQQVQAAVDAGIQREQLILDPGMGAFVSPDPADSIAILQHLDQIKNRFELPTFICSSRK
jgi:dihydropteroate synthase